MSVATISNQFRLVSLPMQQRPDRTFVARASRPRFSRYPAPQPCGRNARATKPSPSKKPRTESPLQIQNRQSSSQGGRAIFARAVVRLIQMESQPNRKLAYGAEDQNF